MKLLKNILSGLSSLSKSYALVAVLSAVKDAPAVTIGSEHRVVKKPSRTILVNRPASFSNLLLKFELSPISYSITFKEPNESLLVEAL